MARTAASRDRLDRVLWIGDHAPLLHL